MVSGSGFHLVTSLSCLALNFPSVRSWGWGAAGTRGLGSGSASGSLCSQTHPGDDGDHLLSVHVAEQHRLHRHDAAHRQRHPEEPLWPEGGSEGPQLGQRRECSKDCPEEAEAPMDLQANSRKEEEYRRNIWKGFLISIPYSASIGGTATLTGTAPNLILLGQLKSFFPQCDVVNFGSWFIFAFPLMLLFLLVGWLWISFLYGGITLRSWRKKKSELRTDAENRARALIQEEFQNLGPIRFAEQAVFILFCMFAILLFSRDPKFIPGWASLFTPGFISDAVTGVSIVTILFFFPCQRPSLKWWLDFKAPNTETEPLLTWKKAQDMVPWNIILLLGGGFAMAKGCEESGLSAWIGRQLHPLENVPPVLAVLLITVVVAFFTEFASNTATIIIFLPVLAELAIRLRVHPLYLMIPATVGCSYAFMLPVSTPPNSIAFASGHLLVRDMVRTGLLMNLMGVLLLSLAMNTWAQSIFQLGTFPDWANIHLANITALPPTLANDTSQTL
ncbi:solute carrier family 13 member 3 isoform X3 [Sus scrofa]|uniref:solute carrier family 13 member 3 isoform X3 n=1 Tax=Sus scrofa TaxID=9823 RepID=UPI000A2B0013|nr:solute carrier family 13 member 3 isoform X3 [Sus scrofa]